MYCFYTDHTSHWNDSMTEQPEKRTKLTAMQKAIKEMIGALEDRAPAAPPPFSEQRKPFIEPVQTAISSLRRARENAAMYAGWFQDDVFNSWSRVFLRAAGDPSEWTQAKVLYENYVHLAGFRDAAKKDSVLAKTLIASQTQWGKMMATKFVKERRTKGYYYPVALKPGAWGDTEKQV